VSRTKPGLYRTLAQNDAIKTFLTGLNVDSLIQIEEELTVYIKKFKPKKLKSLVTLPF
jgi:hypothetical protein